MSALDRNRKWWTPAGVASGVVNTFRQMGVAIMGAIFVSSLGDLTSGAPGSARAFSPGFQDALLLGALIALAGAAIGAATIRKPVRSDGSMFTVVDQTTPIQGGRP